MTTAATAGWRVSEPGERTPDATLEFCLRRLRAEFRGEPLPEGVETLCDVRMAPGTAVRSVAEAVVPPWLRAGQVRGGCEWVLPPGPASGARRVLYCCGGGYTACQPQDYRGLASRLAHSS